MQPRDAREAERARGEVSRGRRGTLGDCPRADLEHRGAVAHVGRWSSVYASCLGFKISLATAACSSSTIMRLAMLLRGSNACSGVGGGRRAGYTAEELTGRWGETC